MGLIQSLVSEDSIDRKESSRSERFFVDDSLQCTTRNSSGMCSQDILLGFCLLPVTIVAETAIPSFLMGLFYFVKVFIQLGVDLCLNRIGDKECIMGVSGWMMLRLEKSVEIPETVFNISIRSHLFETHLH